MNKKEVNPEETDCNTPVKLCFHSPAVIKAHKAATGEEDTTEQIQVEETLVVELDEQPAPKKPAAKKKAAKKTAKKKK